MATKKYVSKDKLEYYDEKIKDVITIGDTETLNDAKAYTNTKVYITEEEIDVICDSGLDAYISQQLGVIENGSY